MRKKTGGVETVITGAAGSASTAGNHYSYSGDASVTYHATSVMFEKDLVFLQINGT